MIRLPDGNIQALLQGVSRVRLTEIDDADEVTIRQVETDGRA